MTQLAAFEPGPRNPLRLEFGLTGLHLLSDATATGSDAEAALDDEAPTEHVVQQPEPQESYSGAFDESTDYKVYTELGNAGLQTDLSADVRMAELASTIEAIETEMNAEHGQQRQADPADNPALREFRAQHDWDADAGHERPAHLNQHIKDTRRGNIQPRAIISAAGKANRVQWGGYVEADGTVALDGGESEAALDGLKMHALRAKAREYDVSKAESDEAHHHSRYHYEQFEAGPLEKECEQVMRKHLAGHMTQTGAIPTAFRSAETDLCVRTAIRRRE
eukprot:COSAG04_NODE_2102_length_4781_cov_1.307988_2_plen_279_part_00